MSNDTIIALATAPAPAGVAVIRISGENCRNIIANHFKSEKDLTKKIRTLALGKIIDENQEVIDSGMAVFFQAPFSYTGEDLIEFHLHGNPLLARKLINSITKNQARLAEPGEFTLRAYLNNKIDLTQAEAVADLISAKSEAALKLANSNLAGNLTNAVIEIGEPLRDILAEIEASVDFADEDIQPDEISELKIKLLEVANKLKESAAEYTRSEILRDGFRILLCGKPNTGKSSLLNKILGKQRAIVSDLSGTTRDIIEESIIYSGYSLLFCDSAGIRTTTDQIEQVGVELAIERLNTSQLILIVAAPDSTSAEVEELLNYCQNSTAIVWLVNNKSDLERQSKNFIGITKVFDVSAKTGAGIDVLLDTIIKDCLETLVGSEDNNKLFINLRQKQCFEAAIPHIDAAQNETRVELISLEIRQALTCLNEIIGKTDNEDLLGRIFSKFCVGK